MGQLTLTIKYRKNSGLVFSVAEIWSLYLFGITINGGQGTSFPMKLFVDILKWLKDKLKIFSILDFVSS